MMRHPLSTMRLLNAFSWSAMFTLLTVVHTAHVNDTADAVEKTTACSRSHFDCGNGICLPARWRCDGDKDCPSGLDEEGCADCLVYSTSHSIGKLCTGTPNTEKILVPSRRGIIVTVDTDVKQGCVYYAELSDYAGKIEVTCLDKAANTSTNRITLRSVKIRRAVGLARDWVTGNLYWLQNGENIRQIGVTSQDGKYSKVLYNGTRFFDRPRGLALHPGIGRLFWSDWSDVKPRIASAAMNGDPSLVTILAEGKEHLGHVNGIALDISTSKLFWTDSILDVIGSMNLDGSDRVVLVQKSNTHPFGVTVSPDFIYWTDWMDRSIFSVRRANLSEVKVVRKVNAPMGIALWAEKPELPTVYSHMEVKCPYLRLLGHNSTTGRSYSQCYCPDGFYATYVNGQQECKVEALNDTAGDCLIYSTRHRIGKICVEDPHVVELLPPDGNNNVVSLDVDFTHKCVYYTDSNYSQVKKSLKVMCLNQNTMTFSLPRIIRSSLNISTIEGIAYDWITDNVYILETDPPRIIVTTPNGRLTKVLYEGTDIFDLPRDLAVHPGLGQLFWADWSSVNPRIVRASMNGDQSSVTILADGKDKFGWVNGIALDIPADKVYWVDAKKDIIGSMNMDGTNRTTFSLNDGSHPFSIAVSSEFIYWTDWRNAEIQAVEKTNAANITVLKKSTTQLMGIALWAEKPTVAMADVSSATECPYIWLLGHNSTTGGAFGQCYCPDGFSANYVKDQLHCDKMNETTEANTFSPANTTNSSSICTADQFNCGDGICIPALWRCDGNTECPSGLDEEDCADCVVYSTQKVIRKFCVGDTYEEELLLLDGRNHALFIDVDFRQKCVYYTDYKPIEMNRTLQVVCWNQTTMAFSSPRIIRSNFYRLEGIAYDWITGNVYTLEAGSRRLSVTTNDGRFTKVLYEGTEIFDRPRDLVVHPGLGQLFWTDWSKVNPRIVRASMSGDQSSIFILAQGKHQLGLLNGIALDIPSSKVYWAETKGKIGSVNMDGTDLSTFPAKNGGFPFSIAVSPELIYWTDWVKSEIHAVRKTNLTNLIVVKKVVKRSPIGIALWAEKPTVEISYLSLATKCPYLWLLGHNSTTGSAYGQCYCPDEFSATLVNGQRECDTMNETTEANTFVPASSFRARPEDCLLYTSRNELHRICLGNDTTSLLVKSSKVSVMDVDVDYAHRCIFYTAFNYATYSVQEFCYQRWETFTPILNSRGAPDGLAYDWAGQNIYWLESTQKALMVTDRNGRYRATLYSGHIFDRPRGLVLNPEKGDLFWADWSNTNPAIMQASMTGNPSSVKALVKTNLGWPNGLALDTKINQLYWTDGKLDKIMKFDLNGNWMREVRDLGPSSHHPFGIAVSDRFIYWSNWRSGSLLAVTKDAPNKSPIITVVKKVFSPNRLAVIPKETKAPRPCSKVCPHLCLTSYNVTTREPDHVCRCADGFLSIKDSYGHFICIGNSSTESVTTEARFPFVFATIEGKNYTVLTSTCRPLRLHRLCPVQCLIQVDFEDGKRCLKCICQ